MNAARRLVGSCGVLRCNLFRAWMAHDFEFVAANRHSAILNGAEATGDDADPAWIDSGMVPNEDMSLGELKALFR